MTNLILKTSHNNTDQTICKISSFKLYFLFFFLETPLKLSCASYYVRFFLNNLNCSFNNLIKDNQSRKNESTHKISQFFFWKCINYTFEHPFDRRQLLEFLTQKYNSFQNSLFCY